MLIRTFFEEIPAMNLGALLKQNQTSAKHYTNTKKGTWQTSAHGGIITPISEACGIDLSAYEAIRGQGKIDLDYLNKIHYITGWVKEEGKLCYNCQDRMGMRGIIFLPNKDLLKLIDGVVRFNPKEVFANLVRDKMSTIRDNHKSTLEDEESGEGERGSEDEGITQRGHDSRFERLEKTNEELKKTMLRMERRSEISPAANNNNLVRRKSTQRERSPHKKENRCTGTTSGKHPNVLIIKFH